MQSLESDLRMVTCSVGRWSVMINHVRHNIELHNLRDQVWQKLGVDPKSCHTLLCTHHHVFSWPKATRYKHHSTARLPFNPTQP